MYVEKSANVTTRNVTFQDCNNSNRNDYGTVLIVNTKGYTSINDRYSEVYSKKYESAIATENSELTIINISMTNKNRISWSMIYTLNSDLTILNTTFANLTSRYATAVYAEYGQTRIRNSRFINLNTNITAGAVAIKGDSNVTIENCQFINVTSTKNGGAIYMDINWIDEEYKFTGTVLIRNVLFDSCSSQFGGAYLQLGGKLEMTNCTFKNNHAHESGGAIYLSDAYPYIADSTFENNTATQEAGAIHSDNSWLTIENCTFKNNHANKSGAIYLLDSYYEIADSTFKNNTKAIHSTFDYDGSYQDANDYGDDEISLNNEEYFPYVFDLSNHIILNPINITGNINDTYFDLRQFNATTPVKNQGYKGTCWAFASAAAFESAYMIATGKKIDISENHIFNGMTRYSIYGDLLTTEAGYAILAQGYILSSIGAIDEKYDTYDELGKISPTILANNTYYATTGIVAPYSNITSYKELLLKYGALTIYTHGDYTNASFYNDKTYAYYCNDSTLGNHFVTIIGWNDTFSASNFNTPPPDDGAWIAKNSWGTDFGDEGYYYISYYDALITTGAAIGYAFTDTPYNKIYQYGLTGDDRTINEPSDNYYYTNYFESNGNDLIAAVGTYFNCNGNYEITIYVNDIEVHRQSGKAMLDGYQTIELDKLIEIKEGDIFAIKIKNDKIPVLCQTRQHFMSGSSIMETNGKTTDLTTRRMTACLKAYTLPIGSDSFKTLTEEINNAGDILTLTHNYTYNIGHDSNAIRIEKDNFVLDGANHTINANGQSGIFVIAGANVTLKNLILINGNATLSGGAIESCGNLTIINCEFENNTAVYSGGAIASKGILSVTNSTFTKNSAGFGGAISAYNSLELYNSSFTQNTATDNGGAAYAYNATVTGATFKNNTAKWSGAICIAENGEISNCIFDSNSAIYSGAIQSDENLTLKNLIFKGNIAHESVGAISFYGTGTIDGCIFENNTSPYCGAAYIEGNVTIENTEFKNNTALYGGNDILTNDYAMLKLNNVTPMGITPMAYVELQIGDEINTTYGSTVKITAKLLHNTVNEGNVSITINGETYSADVKNNTATIEIPGLNAGLYEGVLSFDGGKNYTKDSISVKFTVEKRNIEITAENKAYVINYGGTYSITVKNLASSVEVTFTLNNRVIGAAKTDKNGIATITLTP